MAYPEEQLANDLGYTFRSEQDTNTEDLETKKRELESALDGLANATDIAEAADVQLDFADALEREAQRLRHGYSTVKFRHTGTVGEPGRARARE